MNKTIQFILYRYLILSWISKKKHRNGSAVAVLIPIFGVAIGVFAFTVVISVMSGFVENIKYSILHFEPHITVSSEILGEQIPINYQLQLQIAKMDPNIINISPFQKADVILQAGNRAVIANLQGIDSHLAKQPMDIEKYINHTASLSVLNKILPSKNIQNSSLFPTVILGIDLMNQLDLRVGDTVTLMSPLPDEGPGGLSPTQLPVVVAGYLNSGHFSFDKKIVLTSINTANLFLQNTGAWQGFYLEIKDPLQADFLSKKLNKKLIQLSLSSCTRREERRVQTSEAVHERHSNDEQELNESCIKPLKLQAIPWMENNKSLLKALNLEHYGMIFVLIMIILVGCFSITISLLLSIRRKSKEMAILRSMGLQQLDLSKIYLWQGFLIGCGGIIIGLVFGFMTLYYIHHYTIPFITSSYSSEPLPILISFKDIFFVTFGSLILSMLAAVWPAYEIKNLNVIEILSIRN